MKKERNYKGIWIPRAIWENADMSANEKVLFADIASMVSEGMEFFKSNERHACDLKCSESTAKRAIASLKNLGLIDVYRNGRKRVVVLSNKGKMASEKVQTEKSGGQNIYERGSTRPYSSSRNSSFNNSLEELNLDIGDFYPFRVNPNVHELMREWVDHRIELGKPLTDRQIEKSFENLFLVSKGDLNDAQLCLEQALIGSWSKFYPPRYTDDWYG